MGRTPVSESQACAWFEIAQTPAFRERGEARNFQILAKVLVLEKLSNFRTIRQDGRVSQGGTWACSGLGRPINLRPTRALQTVTKRFFDWLQAHSKVSGLWNQYLTLRTLVVRFTRRDEIRAILGTFATDSTGIVRDR